MRMFKEKSLIQICFALSIILLPFAHWKTTLFGMPLYSVEMPAGVALAIYLYGYWKGTFSPPHNVYLRNLFIGGIMLFFIGALTSFAFNPFTWTGMGMIKTWFVAPLVLIFLWSETKPEKKDIDSILLLWLGVIAMVSLISMEYFFQGNMTFDGRLSAWYTSPNYLAFFLAPGIFLIQYFFFHPIFEKKKWSKIVMGYIFLSLLFSLFLTRSYAVWGSMFIVNFFFLFLNEKDIFFDKKKNWIPLFFFFFFFAFLFFE